MVVQLSAKESRSSKRLSSGRKSVAASKTTGVFNNILSLHSTLGNQAVQRLIESGVLQTKPKVGATKGLFEQDENTVGGQVTRMSKPNVSLEPTHLVWRRDGKSFRASGKPLLQRQADNKGDLQSPRFKGDPLLEDILDGKEEMSRDKNNKGPAVRKVQQALIGAGYSLPKFGADGKFGDETKETVEIFQLTAGLDTGLNRGKGLADGVMRSETMLRLDQIFPPDAKPAGTPPPEREDFLIKGKFEPAFINFGRFFFDFDSSELDSEEKTKAELIVALMSPEQPLDLVGFASEEGASWYNRQLALKRIESVEQALKEAGHTAARTPIPQPEEGSGQLNYRFFRAVEVSPAGSKPKSKTGSEKKKPPVVACGTKVTTALEKGDKMLNKAIKALKNPKKEDTEEALKLFGGASAVPKLAPNLKALQKHLRDNVSKNHVCADETDSRCGSTTMGINSGVGARASIILCPAFMEESDVVVRADFLIHEATHSTEDIQSSDFARRFHRLILELDQDVALRNADSYSLFIRLIDKPAKQPGSVKVGPEIKDKTVGLKGRELKEAQRALAFVEVWVDTANTDTGFLYDRIKKAREDRKWTPSPYQFKMNLLAPRFGLSRPPRVPSAKDQTAVAAIHDRYALMVESVTRTPATGELSLVKSDVDGWGTKGAESGSKARAGDTLNLGPRFFGLSDAYQQVLFLLQLLVEGTPNVSSALVPRYVEFTDLNRQSDGFPNP